MSDRTTVSFRCSDGLARLLDSAADESGVSKSALCREILLDRLDGDEMDLPEHLLIEAQREQIKRQNRIDDLRGGFEGRVLDQFERRFDRSYRPEDMREIAGGYVQEARLLFSEDREQDAVGYVRRLMDRYEDMWEQQDGETPDPSEAFGAVEQQAEQGATETESPSVEIVQDARDRIERLAAPSDSELVAGLRTEHGVSEPVAESAVRRARSGRAGGTADD